MPQEWNLKLAGHLLRQATFGFTASQLQQALVDGPQKTIDRLLAIPAGYTEFEQSIAALTSRETTPLEVAQLQLYRILHTPYPLHEKASFYGTTAAGLLASPAAYRQRVKPPLEYALNLAIPLGVQLAPARLYTQLAALGQRLPDPGGTRRWLNAFTLIGRSNLAASILARVDHFPDHRTLLDTLIQSDAPAAVLEALAPLQGRELAQAIVNLPEYQLL